MTARYLAPALVLALAAPDAVALAQRAHGGRSGGHSGGSARGSAVARQGAPGVRQGSPGMRSAPSRGGSYVRGGGVSGRGVAQYRHPRAGTGSYGRYYGSQHGGYYPSHGYPSHGGYYRPYYGNRYYGYPYYYPYHRPYYYGSLYLGWPYYSAPYYGGGYYTSSYTYAPSYYLEEDAPPPGVYDEQGAAPPPAPRTRPDERALRDSGRLRLEVRPDDASVYVDDGFRGTGREARSLSLAPGRHTVELVRPGYVTERHEVEILTGERTDLSVELRRPAQKE